MAVAHLALADALSRVGLDPIPDSRTQSPMPKPDIEIALSSPFKSNSLTPVSSRGCSPAPSLVPSFRTANSSVSQRRPSPAPITIPAATVDEPLFSSYPFTPSAVKDEALKSTSLSAAPASALAASLNSRSAEGSWKRSIQYDECSSAAPAPLRSQLSMTSLGRRRSTTSINLSTRKQNVSAVKFGEPDSHPSPRRRASLNTDDNGIERWREFGAMSTQFENSTNNAPAYDFLRAENGTDRYTLESVPMVSGVRPLSPPLPTPPPRSSSLIHSQEALLKLAALSIKTDRLGEHPDAGINGFAKEAAADINAAADAVSFVSEPLTSSPSTNTKSLPSTKTSLSRSARSGKEGCVTDDAAIATSDSAAKNAQKERVLVERRRMIILEIVETEITYVHDLQALVHIYLPQLAALPHVPERIHQLVVRNTTDLLQFHVQFAAHLVDILKYNGMGYDAANSEVVDNVTKRVADLFVREVTSFSLYGDYCAGSTTAAALLRTVSHRADYDAFEKRCQYVASTTANPTLRDLLYNRTPQPSRSRHRFQDLLISPVQRVCRYPLLLAALLADVNQELDRNPANCAVENAQAIMRAVAVNADEARQHKEAELKTIAIAERFDPHPAVSYQLLEHLGICRLGGALDVLYHHPQLAPLEAPVKVKYLAAFLYRGYLILAKIKRGNRFEIKHYLPLEAFELIDITEGFLPHSIRLTLSEHNFDLAASCDAEKEVWGNELVAARNESIVSPFELPSSVSLVKLAGRQRLNTAPSEQGHSRSGVSTVTDSNKRHTVTGLEILQAGLVDSPAESPASAEPFSTPVSEYRRTQPATLLLRRASATQRLQVDRALSDVIFESLATARSKVQLQHAVTSESRRTSSLFDTPMLRRRLSFAESRTSLDVLAAPEVRGAVISARVRSRPRTMFSMDGSFDTDGATSRNLSRNTSFSSVSDVPLRGRHSSVSLRRNFEMGMTPRSHRRQSLSISSLNLDAQARARSVPASPIISTAPQVHTVAEPVETIENLTSPPLSTPRVRAHQRTLSDESFVFVPEVVLPPVPVSSKGSPHRASSTGTLKRSMSGLFSSRRSGSSPSLCDLERAESTKTTSPFRPLTKSSSSTSISSTSTDKSPQTPTSKRRRSMRLFGQLRGFTPI